MPPTAPRSPRAARRRIRSAAAAVVLVALLAPTPAPAGAVVDGFAATGRVSVTSTGAQKAHDVGPVVAASSDGRLVAFTVDSALGTGDTNGAPDVYLRDRLGGTSTRVSLTDADTQIQGPSHLCGLSRSGRFVGFVAHGSGLPVPDRAQVYLRDRLERETILVSVSSDELPSSLGDGTSGIGGGEDCAISDDGRFVAFQSEDGDLAPSASHDGDVYRRDLLTGTTQLVNAAAVGGAVPNGGSWDVDISGDGAVVAFTSEANNLVPGDTNGDADVFVRSFPTSTTQRISVKKGGGQVEEGGHDPAITSDGTRVVFTSSATDLVAGDTNGADDVFLRDREVDATLRVSLGPGFAQLAHGGTSGDIGDDAHHIVFSHYSPTDLPGDLNQDDDVLRHDIVTGATEYVSRARNGESGAGQSYHHATSADGKVVVFVSSAYDLVRGDTNASDDVFVRDHFVDTTPFGNGEGFIHQQYLDFLGRAPTPNENAVWETRFSHGEAVPEQLIDELAHTPTWAGTRAPVIRLYWAFFLRVPDKAGMDYWIAEATKGLSLPKMASKFAQSQEFKTKYGSLANGAFVTKVYENVFERAPDAAGLAYWKGQLDTGKKTRGDVMVGFSESAEGRLLLAPATDSVLVWRGMMRTVPPSSWSIPGVAEGYRAGEPPEIVPRSILALPAYADRVS